MFGAKRGLQHPSVKRSHATYLDSSAGSTSRILFNRAQNSQIDYPLSSLKRFQVEFLLQKVPLGSNIAQCVTRRHIMPNS